MRPGEHPEPVRCDDLAATFEGVASHLATWLEATLLQQVGPAWWEQNIRAVFSEEERRRSDGGQWQGIQEMDLSQLLTALGLNLGFLGARNVIDEKEGALVHEMQRVGQRWVGRHSGKLDSLSDLAADMATTERFCRLLGAPGELLQDVRTLCPRLEATFHLGGSPVPATSTGAGSPIVATTPSGTLASRERADGPLLSDAFEGMTLTRSQADAVAQLQLFLDDPKARVFILRGYAGTGKTFLLGGLVRYLKVAKHRQVMMMAPTGRAAHVLCNRNQVDAGTIHRIIYSLDDLKEHREIDENGDVTYKFYFGLKNNESQHSTIFIVDEASMVSDAYSEGEFMRFGTGFLLSDLLSFINFDANDNAKKLILVGDNAQLPPVGMNSSPALDKGYLTRHFRLKCRDAELVDVRRQSVGSLVLSNATRIRELLQSGHLHSFSLKSDGITVTEVTSSGDLVTRFAASYDRTVLQPNSVIVAHSNKSVALYNEMARDRLMPGQPTIAAGDRIIVIRNNYNHAYPLLNGQTGLVVAVSNEMPLETRTATVAGRRGRGGKRAMIDVDMHFRDVVLRFEGDDGTPHEIACKIIEDSITIQDAGLPSRYSKALWLDFRARNTLLEPGTPEFKKAIKNDPWFNAVQIKFGYAVTCHKAQGGEWDTVYVDFEGMNKLEETALRWSYTALTRASRAIVAKDALHHDVLTPKKVESPHTAELAPGTAVSPLPDVKTPPPARPALHATFEEAMASEVQSRVPAGWVMAPAIHLKFLERFIISKDGYSATASISYNGERKVTRVDVGTGTRTDADDELRVALSPIEGIFIYSASDKAGAIAENHISASKELKKLSGETGLTMIRFESKSPYHAVGVFFDGIHVGRFDYFFDKEGRLCKIPTAQGDVFPALVTKVRSLHQPPVETTSQSMAVAG